MSHSQSQITLKIDGKAVQIAAGATILEAAAANGISIPTLCYLQKVSPTGACRICVVEVAGADKTMTACNTRAVDGMEVTTQSEKLSTIRRQVVELLLVNHPLDCPVCDAGGECDLQDICYSQDVTRQPFAADDVNAPTIDHWPLIQQVPNRCIMCEKCVKVCHEVIGASALFVNDKGDRAFIDKELAKCEFCGNCVQVCPTGTMISKPFKFKARPWELRKTASVCTLCSAHCQVEFHSKQGKVLRVTASDGVTLNDGNLCFGGFFGHDFLNSPQRLTAPLVDGQPTGWDVALDKAAAELLRLRDQLGGQAIAGLTSGRLTNEENYLFQKMFRVALGSNNIDSDARFGLLPALSTLHSHLGVMTATNQLEAIGNADTILVFGADPSSESPAVDWQIQLAHRKCDAKLIVANLRRTKLAGQAETFINYRPGSEGQLAAALAKLVVAQERVDLSLVGNSSGLLAYLAGLDLESLCATAGVDRLLLEEAAAYLAQADKVAVIFGRDLMQSSAAASAVPALLDLALVSGACGPHSGVYPLEEKGNAYGALAAGVAPELLPGGTAYAKGDVIASAWHCTLPSGGIDAIELLNAIESGSIRALYLAACNPLADFPDSGRWRRALEKLELLIVQDIFASELTGLAHIVLPGAAAPEKSGTVTALDGRISELSVAAAPPGEARPDAAILAELFASLSGKPLPTVHALRAELSGFGGGCSSCQNQGGYQYCRPPLFQPAAGSLRAAMPALIPPPGAGFHLLIGKSPYQFGSSTGHGQASGELTVADGVHVSPLDASSLGVTGPDARLRVNGPAGAFSAPVVVSAMIPDGLLFVPSHLHGQTPLQAVTLGNCAAVTAAKV